MYKDTMDILFENQDFFVINKPAGILSEAVAKELKISSTTHRLDKDTSGIMVIARNPEYRKRVQNLFKARKVKKQYLALVHGEIKKDGEINAPIIRSQGLKRGVAWGGREAITFYKVKRKYKNFTLLEVFPQTGRTHQVRVHMKYLGHPIVGDRFYKFKRLPNLGLKRQFLHAQEISFLDYKFQAPLAQDLQSALNQLE